MLEFDHGCRAVGLFQQRILLSVLEEEDVIGLSGSYQVHDQSITPSKKRQYWGIGSIWEAGFRHDWGSSLLGTFVRIQCIPCMWSDHDFAQFDWPMPYLDELHHCISQKRLFVEMTKGKYCKLIGFMGFPTTL
jgi:hypothetical protein